MMKSFVRILPFVILFVILAFTIEAILWNWLKLKEKVNND